MESDGKKPPLLMHYVLVIMTNPKKTFLFILFILILLPIISYALNPLHRSTEKIKHKLLSKTEVGFSKEKVKKIGKNKLSLILSEDKYGPPDREKVKPFTNIVHTYLEAELGSHFNHSFPIFRTYVYAYWVFDSKDILIDIIIYKETDAL